MRTRRLATVAALAAIALAGCGGGNSEVAEPSASPVSAVATETSEPPTEDAASEAYMDDDGPKDVTSHMACKDWTNAVDDTALTSETGMSVAGRVIRSDDPEMAALATEAGIGPLITDPWGMTKLCIDHGYEFEKGSIASEHYLDSMAD